MRRPADAGWGTGHCKSCAKRTYPSYAHALSALLYASQRTGRALRIYECPARADRFHLTKRRVM